MKIGLFLWEVVTITVIVFGVFCVFGLRKVGFQDWWLSEREIVAAALG